MPSPIGIRYYSYFDASGYSLAAIGYVRALLNAGVPVHWMRLAWGAQPPRSPAEEAALIRDLSDDATLSDLPALLQQTSSAIPCDTLIAHCVPDLWPALFEPGLRNVGCTVWESDRPPAHWLQPLNSAAMILVPCAMNRADFLRCGVRRPIHVVPHVRRHAVNEFTPAELDAARRQLGIPERNFVFLKIGEWNPRKAIPELIASFLETFEATDPVSLVVKTTAAGHGPPPLYPVSSVHALCQEIIASAERRLARALPHLSLVAADHLSGRQIAQLQALSDCFVSFTHGEGWGLGAFEAVHNGTPVLITGWGGQMDYLGADHPGVLPFAMTGAPIWPPQSPLYHASHRWASVDLAAASKAMRDIVRDPRPARDAALTLQRKLVNRYAEPVVAQQLLRALGSADA